VGGLVLVLGGGGINGSVGDEGVVWWGIVCAGVE